jgi:copper chaperone
MNATIKQEFAVEGMHCGGCVKSVTGALSRLPGVVSVDVSLERRAATVEFDGDAVQPDAIIAVIQKAGFEARPR